MHPQLTSPLRSSLDATAARLAVRSAGSHPDEQIDSAVTQAMAEAALM